MAVGEQVVGVITLNTRQARQYNATDVQTLSLLANQTASALERARYFEQVQRRVVRFARQLSGARVGPMKDFSAIYAFLNARRP